MIVIEEFDDFCKRQDCISVWTKGRYLFRNGAQSDGDQRHSDPPEEPLPRLHFQREFLLFRLDTFVKQFNQIKSYVDEQAAMSRRYSNLPTPSVDAPKDLRRLQGVIFRLREKIKAIEEELKKIDPEYHLKVQRVQSEARRKALIASVVDECKDINI